MRTGENIYKRKDGRWEARYRKGRNENGRIIYGSCYGKTYTEVKSKLELAKSDIAGTAIPKYSTPRFDAICNEWLQSNRLRLKNQLLCCYADCVPHTLEMTNRSAALMLKFHASYGTRPSGRRGRLPRGRSVRRCNRSTG